MEYNIKCTKRFVIEPSLECNIKCKFCYHLHRYDTWKDTRKSFDEMKKIIDDGINRGNDYMDITGGEPTIYPYITELIEYGLLKGIKTCIITNGIVGEKKTEQIIKAGIDDFLVSRHGLEQTHNNVTNTKDGYSRQIRFLEQIKNRTNLRFNVVINKFNQNEIEDIAYYLGKWNPRIINFINMNPHHEWKNKDLAVKDVIADLEIVEPLLYKAIEYLENKSIGVNVRYYPMCRIALKYKRCICNDKQVMFDSFEWDYSTLPKTIERYTEWGRVTSNNNEEKKEPCCDCDLQNVCGGINKYFHKVSNEIYGEVCAPIIYVENINKNDFMLYRRDNIRTI